MNKATLDKGRKVTLTRKMAEYRKTGGSKLYTEKTCCFIQVHLCVFFSRPVNLSIRLSHLYLKANPLLSLFNLVPQLNQCHLRQKKAQDFPVKVLKEKLQHYLIVLLIRVSVLLKICQTFTDLALGKIWEEVWQTLWEIL